MELEDVDDTTYDLCEILASDKRDFLIRNNGDEVKIKSLKEGKKIVGIYLCRFEVPDTNVLPNYCSEYITPLLVNVYHEIASSKGDDFEVVMVSLGEDEESFDAHFSQMPWLAVPHSHSMAVRKQLEAILGQLAFRYWNMAIFDKSGKILFRDATDTLHDYGADAYPFTRERIIWLHEEEAVARQNKSLNSLLGDYLISGTTQNLIPVSQLEGKTVAIYFERPHSDNQFADLLVRVNNQLKDRGEAFEVVFVPHGIGSHSTLMSMPWLALPFRDKRCERLRRYLRREEDSPIRVSGPMVYIIGPDGKTLSGARGIQLYGADAFPFTRQRFDWLDQRVKQGPWSLKTLLDFHGRDFVIRKNGSKVPVAQLVGKTVMLLFWGIYFRGPVKVMESCRGIKEKDDAFEMICIGFSKEHIGTSLDDWMLAFPENDVRGLRLCFMFDVLCIPTVILLDSCCRIVTTKANDSMIVHGANDYPFTADHLEMLEERASEIAKGWPEKVLEPEIHEHEIHRVPCEVYDCDGCYRSRNRWNFKCTECDGFDLHEHYAFGGDNDDRKPDGRSLMETFISSN